jgi:Protein of unknown function (DUF732)
MIKLSTIGAAVAVAALLSSASAHADPNSYVDYLRSHGQLVPGGFEGTTLAFGNMMCSQLRNGIPHDQVLAGFQGGIGMKVGDPAIGMDAAQHELCPDTLH